MKKILLFTILFVASLACEKITPTPEEWPPLTQPPEVLASPTALVLVETIQPDSTIDIVTVEYDLVNLRNGDGSASGQVVSRGQVLAVQFQSDGWSLIVREPYQGMYIWRGCVSQPASYGCEVSK